MEELRQQYESLGISEQVFNKAENVLSLLHDEFHKIDKVAEYNQLKVIKAFQNHKISEAHFVATTGYGYNDLGRDTLEEIYADVFKTEDALVRPQIVSGTHAITLALSANLYPGDKMLYITGKPYDTMDEVIGIRDNESSLKEYGISYGQIELTEDGDFDFDAIKEAITNEVKLIAIQRSSGYDSRPSLVVDKIGEAINFIKDINKDIIIMVDNCYGEFVETKEPSEFGADMVVGSLIKNPGGGLAPIGGYICGTKECIKRCSYKLTSPGLGKEVGANLGTMNLLYQGLFMAPTVTVAALKGAIFASHLFDGYGFTLNPTKDVKRADIIQSIEFNNPDCLVAFCKGIQEAAAIDSHLTPEPWDMPGYDSQVIMAAGAFVQGSSIELSADGPMKPPFAVYFQGGLTFPHAKFGITKAFQNLVDLGLISL